jgi:hypothetical protein
MDRTCRHCQQGFVLTEDELAMVKKFDVPAPEQCFACGQKRRLLFRNGRHLYRRTCDATGDSIISIYAPDKPYKVYKSDFWFSDRWDPLDYAREIDFSRPFFDQLRDLILTVPRLALTNINAVNSDYCNMSEGNKNCYLIFGGDFNEDSMYGIFGMRNKSVIDCDSSNENERCYWMGDSFNCYGCQFTFDSKNCSDCAFISDSTGCRDCILCTNLTQKQYCIENEQLSKEEYEKHKAELLDGSHSRQGKNLARLHDLRAKRIVRPAHILASEDCSGDYIVNSKNCYACFDSWDCQDMRNIILASKTKDALNSSCIGDRTEMAYEMQSTINAYDCRFSFSVFDSQSVECSDFVLNSSNIFGGVCLNKKHYCILNRQYSEEEFRRLRVKLIEHMKKTGEWGRFLPTSLCPFGYNESTAADYWPLTKEQALAEGFSWYDQQEEPLAVEKTIAAGQLPDGIVDTPDDVLNWAITCEKSGRLFRLIRQELEFYRQNNLPLPRLHPSERHLERLSMRTPRYLHNRQCANCKKAIKTVYTPDRPETVYCEECYLSAVY